MRILLVEDERSAARMTAQGLREHGHAVDIVGDGAAALRQAAATVYDLVILDVLLPVKNGVAVCRELRNNGNAVPVLMLTARDAVDDRIAGLDAGADDYLTKPFHFGELLARVRAMTRRRLPLLPERLDCGRLVLNTRTQEARVDDRLVELTAREYALLEYLCRHQGGVVSREEMAERVWDGRYDPCSNVIDVYVQRLRRKLDTGRDSFIRTRRGAGYQLVAEGDS
jgi:two-component system, OmpR family, copper resistance phosphate regulon response regulator CusR